MVYHAVGASLQRQIDCPVFNGQLDAGGFGRFLQGGIEHDDRVATDVEAPHKAFPFFVTDREHDLESTALAFDGRAVWKLGVEGLEIRVHVMDANARLVVGFFRQLFESNGIYVAEFRFHAGLSCFELRYPSKAFRNARMWSGVLPQ